MGAAVLGVIGGAVWLLGSHEPDEIPVAAPVSTGSRLQASFLQFDVPTWAAYAEVIVIGRVQATQSSSRGVTLSKSRRAQLRAEGYTDSEVDSWVRFEESIVHTTSVVRISEMLKGDLAGDTVEVRHRGGVYGGHKTTADGFPQLLPGREYLLVLARTFDGAWEVANAYEISKGVATSTMGGRIEGWPLDDLVALIRQHVNDPNPFAVAETAESTTAPEPSPAAAPADEASHTTAP
jgi:hypothetical protein